MKLYRIVDWPDRTDWRNLKMERLNFSDKMARKHHIKAIATGEFRRAKKGEWYLSGAIVEAYAWNSETPSQDKFHIAKLVLTKP